jgi:hypothetical protein
MGSIGCESGGDGATAADASSTDTSAAPSSEAAPQDAGAEGAPAADAGAQGQSFPWSYVRMANWSPNTPAVDLCLAPHGTTAFQGPLVGAQLGALDGGQELVSFPQLTAYIPVTAQSYDARLVVAGAPDCATRLVTDVINVPGLGQGGSSATLAVVGDFAAAQPAFKPQMIAMQDDALAPDLSHVEVRFIHAASNSAAVDMGTGSLASAAFQPLFSNVPFGAVATPAEAKATVPDGGAAPHIDDAGYRSVSPLVKSAVSAHLTVGAHGVDEATGMMLGAGGSIVTLVLLPISLAAVDSGGPSARLLECVDNGAGFAPLSDCFLL